MIPAGQHEKRTWALLFLIGVCLSISQFVMIRDFVTILYGEEVVIVLVTAAFFAGLSMGYLLSLKLSRRVFELLFLGSAFFHLTFPFSYRYLAVWMSSLERGGAGFLGLTFGYALIFGSMYATFLPRLIHEKSSDSDLVPHLRKLYSFELLGFLAGFLIVAWSWNRSLDALLPVYWLILAVILHLVLGAKVWTCAYIGTALLLSMELREVDLQSSTRLYQTKHRIEDARVLFSINSPYQKVEVVENGKGERSLYLDGLENLNSGDLEILNYYIAAVPASLVQPRRALLIGNGTLSSVSKVYPFSGQVFSVELDAGVLQAGKRFFTPEETLSGLRRWKLFVDDGKHFLKATTDLFDLIIMDIPSPLTVQEASLHTVEFYQLARDRMGPEGVISVQLSGRLGTNNRTPAQVTAALARVFREVMVVDSRKADRSFAYASDHLPFKAHQLENIIKTYESSFQIIPPERIGSYLGKAEPMALDNLDLVFRRGWERFMDRYFDAD